MKAYHQVAAKRSMYDIYMYTYTHTHTHTHTHTYIYIHNLRHENDLIPSQITTQFYFSITL